ncbi:hypothetical protein [Absidia glauca]|uniref:Uncharacterized protein n=1 Tax=Absidia glauca TaxID=4829 RepID=A0A163ITW3_ABSGL|nr:hypothetical protein [Absidia glauca]
MAKIVITGYGKKVAQDDAYKPMRSTPESQVEAIPSLLPLSFDDDTHLLIYKYGGSNLAAYGSWSTIYYPDANDFWEKK